MLHSLILERGTSHSHIYSCVKAFQCYVIWLGHSSAVFVVVAEMQNDSSMQPTLGLVIQQPTSTLDRNSARRSAVACQTMIPGAADV